MKIELDDNQVWYVQAALHRGIAAVEDTIRNCQRLADEARDPDNACPAWAADAMDNQRAYNEQLLREMRQYIPEKLIPQ